MEITFIYLIPVAVIILVCICWYILDRRTGIEIEEQFERDKERIDKFTASINISTAGLEESKELSERIRTNQQSAKRTVTEATESVRTAKERSRTTVELADECLQILEEAEKTKE